MFSSHSGSSRLAVARVLGHEHVEALGELLHEGQDRPARRSRRARNRSGVPLPPRRKWVRQPSTRRSLGELHAVLRFLRIDAGLARWRAECRRSSSAPSRARRRRRESPRAPAAARRRSCGLRAFGSCAFSSRSTIASGMQRAEELLAHPARRARRRNRGDADQDRQRATPALRQPGCVTAYDLDIHAELRLHEVGARSRLGAASPCGFQSGGGSMRHVGDAEHEVELALDLGARRELVRAAHATAPSRAVPCC